VDILNQLSLITDSVGEVIQCYRYSIYSTKLPTRLIDGSSALMYVYKNYSIYRLISTQKVIEIKIFD